MTKRWECTVCGYIHVGEEPPEFCPVCGADRSQFIPLDSEQTGLLGDLVATFRLHPVAAHFPGGLIPTAGLFVALFLVTGTSALESTAYSLIVMVTATLPIALGSGLYAWKSFFGGQRAAIFSKKIALALALLALCLIASTLRYGHPDLLITGSWQRWLYLFCLTGMLGCMTLLGHYGSKLALQLPSKLLKERADTGEGTEIDWPGEIIAGAPDAMLAADTDGIIRFWNQGSERIFGIPAAKAIGQSLDLIIPQSLRLRHWEGWAKVMRGGESRYGVDLLRVPALRGDGSRFSAEFSIVMLKDKAGRITGVAAILRDVSEQWAREKQLQEQLAACREQQPS